MDAANLEHNRVVRAGTPTSVPPMEWGQVIAIVGAATVAVAALSRELIAGRGVRARLRQDVELLNLLPKDSEAHELLSAHVDRAVAQLVEYDSEMRRDWSGVGAGVMVSVFAVISAIRAREGSDWFWLLVAFWVLCAIALLSEGLPKAHRTASGSRIKETEATVDDDEPDGDAS